MEATVAPTSPAAMTVREVVRIIREELERYRRMYRQAEAAHRENPTVTPDRRERWYGAIRALERVLERVFGTARKRE